jgi:hypothetical protein
VQGMVGDEPAIIFCFLRKHSMKPTKNIFVSFKYSLIETEKHCKGSIRLTEMLSFYLNEIILKNKGVISYRLTSNLAEYVFDFLIKSNIKKIII